MFFDSTLFIILFKFFSGFISTTLIVFAIYLSLFWPNLIYHIHRRQEERRQRQEQQQHQAQAQGEVQAQTSAASTSVFVTIAPSSTTPATTTTTTNSTSPPQLLSAQSLLDQSLQSGPPLNRFLPTTSPLSSTSSSAPFQHRRVRHCPECTHPQVTPHCHFNPQARGRGRRGYRLWTTDQWDNWTEQVTA